MKLLFLFLIILFLFPPSALAHSGEIRNLPQSKTGLACVDKNQPHYRLVYAYPRDTTSNLQRREKTFWQALQNAAGALDARYTKYHQSKRVRLPIICQIDSLMLSTSGKETTFETLKDDLRKNGYAELASPVPSRALVILDYRNTRPISYAGESESFVPLNSQIASLSGLISVHYVYKDNQSIASGTILHELLHSMGAVMTGAPGTDGSGHCLDGPDILCGFGKTKKECTFITIDCNSDTYFQANPARYSYLYNGWNIAGDENFWLRFVSLEEAKRIDQKYSFRQILENTPPKPENVHLVETLSAKTAVLKIDNLQTDKVVAWNSFGGAIGVQVAANTVKIERFDAMNDTIQMQLRMVSSIGTWSEPSEMISITFPDDVSPPAEVQKTKLQKHLKADTIRWSRGSSEIDDAEFYFLENRICKGKRCKWKPLHVFSAAALQYKFVYKKQWKKNKNGKIVAEKMQYRIRASDFSGNYNNWKVIR